MFTLLSDSRNILHGIRVETDIGQQRVHSGAGLMSRVSKVIGVRVWVIPEGYIPASSTGPKPQMEGHETACILNTTDRDAHVEVTAYFSDREPAGPYRVSVPARRTMHLRFNDLEDPEPIPRSTDYSSVLESDVPIVVQHTRLDSRQSQNALLSTVAYAQTAEAAG